MKQVKFSLCLALTLVVAFVAAQRPEPTLKVGDQAPPLKAQSWIKGKPVKGYQDGHIYIVYLCSSG